MSAARGHVSIHGRCNQKKYMEMVLQVVVSPPYPVGKVAQRTFQLLKFLMAVFSFSHQFLK